MVDFLFAFEGEEDLFEEEGEERKGVFTDFLP